MHANSVISLLYTKVLSSIDKLIQSVIKSTNNKIMKQNNSYCSLSHLVSVCPLTVGTYYHLYLFYLVLFLSIIVLVCCIYLDYRIKRRVMLTLTEYPASFPYWKSTCLASVFNFAFWISILSWNSMYVLDYN